MCQETTKKTYYIGFNPDQEKPTITDICELLNGYQLHNATMIEIHGLFNGRYESGFKVVVIDDWSISRHETLKELFELDLELDSVMLTEEELKEVRY